MVPGAGIEPARPCGHKILSLAWLPITPSRHARQAHKALPCRIRLGGQIRESWAGIEPAHGGFAVPSVTSSPPGLIACL